jgi:TRAP-type C4-dicarboxylate transport system permease large subunit
MILFNETFKSYNSFILMAVPFFLLTANLMNVGGITDRLVRLSRDLVGHLPGGLAQVNVVLSIFFAGISGRRPPTRRARARSSSRRRSRRATTSRSRSRSPRSRRCSR